MEARVQDAFGLASIATLLVEVMDVNDHAPKVTLITLFTMSPRTLCLAL